MDRVGERDRQCVDADNGVHSTASDHQDVVFRVLLHHRSASLFPPRPVWRGYEMRFGPSHTDPLEVAPVERGLSDLSATVRGCEAPPESALGKTKVKGRNVGWEGVGRQDRQGRHRTCSCCLTGNAD
ncbi:hypothetical protein GCM10010207_35000 [Streptomyces atratus]|nr:hypothetical protein GCM10010207_35000 [Streptomyces atratus]